jgi:light-regulated signal transduction histidine kinase (bacteriophytochrome)
MPPELATTLTQFGVAGLIAWMWLTERRAAAERERQLSEAHARILAESADRAALLDALKDCTKAMVGLECAQRALADVIDRLDRRSSSPHAKDAA